MTFQKKALNEYSKNEEAMRQVYCFCFNENLIYAGYGDGLICCFQKEEKSNEQTDYDGQARMPISLIGHTNKVLHLEAVPGTDKLFSCSLDCTVRQWQTSSAFCERVIKFQDPVNICKLHLEMNALFCASWDKQIRALDLETGTL